MDRKPLTRRGFLIGGAIVVVHIGCGGGGSSSNTDGDIGNQAPVWTPIPDQSWVVGVPVSFDLLAYCSDADGDALSFTLEGSLPSGLSLVGSVITGTPTQVTAPAAITITADDGHA